MRATVFKRIPRRWGIVLLLAAILVVVVAISSLEQAAHHYIPSGPQSWLVGTVTAGPVCPVEQLPPASACAPRSVGGAALVLSSREQGVVARATTASDGSYRITLHGYGTYTLTAQPVRGLLGTPAPVRVTLNPGQTTRVDLEYDTGIR